MVWVYSQSSPFPLWERVKEKPLVAIGPGTGLAPFLAYLQEKEIEGGDASNRFVLFFGCKNDSNDFIYKERLEEMKEKN